MMDSKEKKDKIQKDTEKDKISLRQRQKGMISKKEKHGAVIPSGFEINSSVPARTE